MSKDSVQEAIKVIASKFKDQGITWLVGGSGSLMLHGLQILPTDLNVIVDSGSYAKAVDLLREYMTVETTRHHDGTNTMFRINEIEVEVIDYSIDLNHTAQIALSDFEIPVYKLEVEHGFYKNREDKKETTKMIEEALNS